MSGHTPGPWFFEERAYHQFGVHAHRLATGGFNRRICLTNSPRTYENDELDAENEANARLIASAPDLLEALKDAIQHCAWCDGTGKEYTHEDEAAVGCSPGSSEISCSHCKDWRKVLAKAEET